MKGVHDNGDSKKKWDELDQLMKIGVGVAAALVMVLFVAKILPPLVTGMGITVRLVVLFVTYWLPTIIAFNRKHPNKGGIFALNLGSTITATAAAASQPRMSVVVESILPLQLLAHVIAFSLR